MAGLIGIVKIIGKDNISVQIISHLQDGIVGCIEFLSVLHQCFLIAGAYLLAFFLTLL